MDYISLRELCEELSISTATGRNWIKLGKLIPIHTDSKAPCFTREYVDALKNEIQSGDNTSLKSRRNKKYVSGNALYNSYVSSACKNTSILHNLLDIIAREEISLNTEIIQYFVADCTLHIFSEKVQLSWKGQQNLLAKYLKGEISIKKYDTLIDALITNRDKAIAFCEEYPSVFCLDYAYEPKVDILGLIYISCKSIGNRKVTGSYYTPTTVVDKLISRLDITSKDKILDPCCGTGNFLLQIPEEIGFENVYGNDLDSVSVKITRLNMALKYSYASVEDICQHITEADYLTEYRQHDFNYIIGNPPWGYDFSDGAGEELRRLYNTATGKNIESYDVFVEKALSDLAPNGQLAFVLPEAILNVRAHADIRKFILQVSSIKYLEFLGNTFDGVQCPCIILHIKKTGTRLSTVGMTVNTEKETFDIKTERAVTADNFSFIMNDSEYAVLDKIKHTEGVSTLSGNACFALGIVTGDNKAYISDKKTENYEMILKGSDIRKYHINQPKNYIYFKPESFQQVAPERMYRAQEKLVYRFICRQLVFAYDDRQTLSLNSCNILIPKLPGTKIKYILALLNSRVAQFIYKKEFNSVKVLRSHIESIPIPMIDEEAQDKIIAITELLIQGQDIAQATILYEKLDSMIFELFNLTPKEQAIIKAAVDGENNFLA